MSTTPVKVKIYQYIFLKSTIETIRLNIPIRSRRLRTPRRIPRIANIRPRLLRVLLQPPSPRRRRLPHWRWRGRLDLRRLRRGWHRRWTNKRRLSRRRPIRRRPGPRTRAGKPVDRVRAALMAVSVLRRVSASVAVLLVVVASAGS